MTVNYTAKVATSRSFVFLSLLRRWKGSVYKLIVGDMALFGACYIVLAIIVNLQTHETKQQMRRVSHWVNFYTNGPIMAGLSFIMGFFVSHVFSRYWEQFLLIPWPDRLAFLTTSYIIGTSNRARLIRRTLLRYVNASIVCGLTAVSKRVKARFPTQEHYVAAGLLDDNESRLMLACGDESMTYNVPLGWAASLLHRCQKEKLLDDIHGAERLHSELNHIRGKLGSLVMYATTPLPLIYVQLVFISLHAYFTTAILTRQFFSEMDGEYDHNPNAQSGLRISTRYNVYVPFFTIVQFMIYMGWAKLSKSLLSPFGDFDNSFDVHQLIDRHLGVSYLIVDDLNGIFPELQKDDYFDLPSDMVDLPYSAATDHLRTRLPFSGSTNERDANESANRPESRNIRSRLNSAMKPPSLNSHPLNALRRRFSSETIKQVFSDDVSFHVERAESVPFP